MSETQARKRYMKRRKNRVSKACRTAYGKSTCKGCACLCHSL